MTKTVKVFQIGVGDFGRHSFEYFVDMTLHHESIEVKLEAVCEPDIDKRESVEKYSEIHSIEIKTFKESDKLFEYADALNDDDVEILIYDAGPSELHSEHIYKSMRHNFFHLTEKPPSTNRGQHIREKKLSEEKDVMWKVDFIERENPVIIKALEIFETEKLENLRIFRENSIGVKKILNPVERLGVKGGDILDKMIHEVYTLDFIETQNEELDYQMIDTSCKYYMPKKENSDKFLAIDNGYTSEVNYNTATAQTQCKLEFGDIDVQLHSSWIGLSDKAQYAASNIKKKTGYKPVKKTFNQRNNSKAFLDEEARFFIAEGSRNIVGDMLNKRIFDLDTGEELTVPELGHDQLYRVLEKAIVNAYGKNDRLVSEKETDIFMNLIFDIKESVADVDNDFEYLDRSRERLKELIVFDSKILENEESETLAG